MDPVQLGLTPSVAQWVEFFLRLGPTDEAATSESTGEINKICVVCRFLYEFREPVLCLYLIDLSSARKDDDDSVQPVQPVFQFDVSFGSRIYREFVVSGSRLFMFGQWDRDACCWTRDCCFYDFSRALCSPARTIVKERDFVRGRPMMSRKFHPVAAVVDSYRICVFATRLHDLNWRGKRYAGVYEPPSFEVLDTREMSWTQLPEPIFTSSEQKLERIEITSYYIERSCLIICTYVGIYGINIDDANPKWEKMEGIKRVRGELFHGRWTVVGKTMCYPFEVVRWGETKPYPFAESCVVIGEQEYGAMCSKRDGGSIVLCRVQGSFVPDSCTRALLVKIFKLNDESVENLTGDMWEMIESEKSACYALETRKCNRVRIMGCFEFKEEGKESGTKDTATEDGKKRAIFDHRKVVKKKSMDTKRAGETKRGSNSGERPRWR